MQHKKARQALEGAAKGGLRSNGVGRDPRNPGSATHNERQAAKGMAVPKASAAKKFKRLITNTTLSKFTWKSILCAAEGKSG